MDSALPPRLGRALLGILDDEPMSGYEVRKLFASTPFEAFSDSPGSVYPALKKLERDGLIEGRNPDTGSRRPRRVYRLTDAGRAMLRRWLLQPVTLDDVKRNADDLTLRFAFSMPVIGRAAVLHFLAEWESALAQYTASLESYHAAESAALPITGRLALESGVELVQGRLRWVRRAISEVRANDDGERR